MTAEPTPIVTVEILFNNMHKLLTPTESINSLSLQASCQILYYYKNATSQLQIIRISNIANCYFERVVFPGEQLFFEALPEAELEIHTDTADGTVLADKILCSTLPVCS